MIDSILLEPALLDNFIFIIHSVMRLSYHRYIETTILELFSELLSVANKLECAKLRHMGTAIERPRIEWTEALEDDIAKRLLTRSLRRICSEDEDIPSRASINERLSISERFWTICARSRKLHALMRLEQVEEDLDTITPQNAKAVHVKVGYAQWLAERLLSKEYGDKTPAINVQANLGIQLVHAIPRPSVRSTDPPAEIVDAEVVPLLSDTTTPDIE